MAETTGSPSQDPSQEGRPLALVTGASSGIGFELAKRFAEDGYDLVVVAEDEELHDAAVQLAAVGTDVRVVQTDLSTYEGVEHAWQSVEELGRPLDAAALNAGVGRGGPFLETELAKEIELIDLNVTGTVHLAKRVLPPMVERGSGRVLVTSSIASTMPGSYQAVYNASKSFVQSFTEALQEELRDSPVTVTSLMPGPTETEFFERADMMDTRVGQSSSKDDPAQVARQGYEAMVRGERKVVAGSATTKLQGVANKVLPDALKGKAHTGMAEPEDG